MIASQFGSYDVASRHGRGGVFFARAGLSRWA